MLRENLRDAADIVSNILSQPLDVLDGPSQVSLLTAIACYDSAVPLRSDLCKILEAFVKYPEPAQRLIQELELLSRDLCV